MLAGLCSSGDGMRYLTRESDAASAFLGIFEAFEGRFQPVTKGRVHDRLLNVTWVLLPEATNPGAIMRLDWESAQHLARRIKARLPAPDELKTLITEEHDPQGEAFTNIKFFRLNPRTKRCWTSAHAGLFQPYHRTYIDFGKPSWGRTSMSEIYCILLIAKEPDSFCNN